ncbi:hypothetical protein [Tateyamaria omphalii]|uniref:Uncharacterized protein n=1 Tax=Tateyamaria omphalii TaxID=299262 RepID=A0A1P8MZL7_9RHOB|nr:hypothetical protein [Tateyamaria omphalii]APX13432.1 hypothetical protein BWR18_18390 [Tateyamaria omphalii]
MSEDPPVPLTLEGYLLFFGVLLVLIVVLFWWLQKHEKRARDSFFAQFDPSELRMSPHKVGLVFKVVRADGDIVIVQPVWDGKAAILNGKEARLTAVQVMPFDASRFFA